VHSAVLVEKIIPKLAFWSVNRILNSTAAGTLRNASKLINSAVYSVHIE
jgi:hypothetical protein